MRIAALYTAFAILATLVNLGAQRAVLAIGAGFIPALLVGTALGLVVKYVLDKRWIFGDTDTGAAAHSRKFSLYTLMGVVTTAIFWGMESLFWVLTHSHLWREAGAILGLSIGYVVKYHLDKRLVFVPHARAT